MVLGKEEGEREVLAVASVYGKLVKSIGVSG
jgi:hypothetical protein